jgi:NAD(P)-dependent dehydrogenase (short-subunit alcohol dehydrogenase family)
MPTSLQGQTAVIYGAGGAIGGAVARAFARHGATLHLTGPNRASLEVQAESIKKAGGQCSVAVVDALDERAIEAHLATIERIDISFNAVGFDEVQGVPIIDLTLRDFEFPIASWSRTVFLTCRAAARRMVEQKSGVILTVKPGNEGSAYASGFGAAVAAVGSISQTLATEVARHGVRVFILQPNALPESASLQKSFRKYATGAGIDPESALADYERSADFGRLPRLDEVGEIAAFLVSDTATMMAGSTITIGR